MVLGALSSALGNLIDQREQREKSSKPRVISLLPAATEMIYLLGAGDQLVGRSHECDFPAELAEHGVPAITAPVNEFTDSADMNDIVACSITDGQSLYTLDSASLQKLEPDIIVTQSLCDVCAVSLNLVKAAAQNLSPSPRIVDLNPLNFEQVMEDMLKIGTALGIEDRAVEVVQELVDRVEVGETLAEAYLNKRNKITRKKKSNQEDEEENYDPRDRPTVAFVEWTAPLYIGGHWTPELIHMAGGYHPLNPAVGQGDDDDDDDPTGKKKTQVNPTAGKSIALENIALLESDPDIIIVCPCGLDLETSRRELAKSLEKEEWWTDLSAVKTDRVWVVDGNSMFNRSGPRLVDAFEWLVNIINSDMIASLDDEDADEMEKAVKGIMPPEFPARKLSDMTRISQP